jgi:hypothetical protein
MRGMIMLAVFFILLGGIFSPLFPGGVNGLVFMDNLFNTISKGSSYFIPGWMEESKSFDGKIIGVTMNLADEKQAAETARLFQASGAETAISGKNLTVKGDMGQIMRNCLEDADNMFYNRGAPLAEKYGYGEKEVLFNWWTALKGVTKDLTRQKSFKEAKIFSTIQVKALEPAYNYYGVEASNYKDNFILIIAALVFYVFYTLWYGFGIMYLFEGVGLKIGH